MGVCNSKAASRSATTSPEPQNEQQQAVETGEPPAVVSSQQAEKPAAELAEPAAADEPGPAVDEPKTPHHDVASDEEQQQVHKYNSAEKPFRSAMRVSESRSDSYSRRSTGVSNVGFSVTVDAPDEEQHKSFAGANSISLKKILDIFYDKVVSHEQIGVYFDGIDLVKLKRHQLRFMGLAFGGKELIIEEDPNLNLRKIHYHLIRDKGLSLAHWEIFVGLFDETLDQLEKEIPLETRQAAMRSIHATKHYFVPIGEEDEFTNTTIAALPVAEEDAGKCPVAT